MNGNCLSLNESLGRTMLPLWRGHPRLRPDLMFCVSSEVMGKVLLGELSCTQTGLVLNCFIRRWGRRGFGCER